MNGKQYPWIFTENPTVKTIMQTEIPEKEKAMISNIQKIVFIF